MTTHCPIRKTGKNCCSILKEWTAGSTHCLARTIRVLSMIILFNHKIRFSLLGEPVNTTKGVRVLLDTEKGPKEICCAKWAVSIYRYKENGKEFAEAWIPEWLCEKAKLVRRSE